MSDMTKEKLIETIVGGLPYPHQMRDIDISSETEAVRFNWRGVRYRVGFSLHVEEVGDGILRGSDCAILMQAVLTRFHLYGGVTLT